MDNQFDFHLNHLKKLLEERIVGGSDFQTTLNTLRSVSQRLNNKTAEETIRLLELAPNLPFPLAVTVSEYAVETNPFVKLHRLTDAAEIITRFITTIMLSDVFSRRRTFPPMLRQALLEKIERPTFGAWKDLLNLSYQALKTKCFVPGLPTFIKSHLLPALGSSDGDYERELIALRNLLAHQGRITDTRALQLLSLHQRTFESLIDAVSFLSGVDFIASNAAGKIISLQGLFERDLGAGYDSPPELGPLLKPERVILVSGEGGLDLFPLQIFGEVMRWRNHNLEQITETSVQLYLRFNGKGLLEYTTFTDQAALSQRDGDALRRFHEMYKLDEWRRLAREDKQRSRLVFDELVNALLEIFVGRDEQVADVKQKVKSTSNGLLWLTGKPGIGKSALMARLTRDYRGAVQHYLTIPYFFAAGHAGCSVDEFIRTSLLLFNKEIDDPVILNLDPEAKRSQFIETVRQLATTKDRKILFLIDGLD